VVDTTTEDIVEVLKREEAAGRPVDLAIDCLGGEVLGRCLKYVARGCRWIQIATLAGDISPIDFRNIYVKNIRIIGSTLRSKTPQEKGQLFDRPVTFSAEYHLIQVQGHAPIAPGTLEHLLDVLFQGQVDDSDRQAALPGHDGGGPPMVAVQYQVSAGAYFIHCKRFDVMFNGGAGPEPAKILAVFGDDSRIGADVRHAEFIVRVGVEIFTGGPPDQQAAQESRPDRDVFSLGVFEFFF
jgi:hypothetical protein